MINLNEFENYCLNLSIIKKYIKKYNKENKKTENEITKKKEILIPKVNIKNSKTDELLYNVNKNNSLFWCFYILQNGFFSFETIKNDFIEINKYKYFYIEQIKKNKKILKDNKFNIKNIETNLTNYENMSIVTFSALCYIFEYNFCIFDKKICYNLNIFDNSKNICIIKKKYNYLIYVKEDINEYIKKNIENKYIITNFSKPLRSISSYKVNDLINIAKKLQINTKDKKKKDIYLLLKNYF